MEIGNDILCTAVKTEVLKLNNGPVYSNVENRQ